MTGSNNQQNKFVAANASHACFVHTYVRLFVRSFVRRCERDVFEWKLNRKKSTVCMCVLLLCFCGQILRLYRSLFVNIWSIKDIIYNTVNLEFVLKWSESEKVNNKKKIINELLKWIVLWHFWLNKKRGKARKKTI